MASEEPPSSAPASPISPTSRGPVYLAVAVVVVVAVIVVGLGLANVIPGFHLGANGSPATSPSAKFPVEFSETGLGAGVAWSVVLAGTTGSSTNGTLTFEEPAGTYSYTVGDVRGYLVTPASGTVTVPGPGTSVDLTFNLQTAANLYGVTFSETGLSASTTWEVTFNGSTTSGSSGTIAFSVPNGSYAFSVGPVSGYVATPSSGSVPVAGATAIVAIVFSGSTAGEYSLTFNASGLPPDTVWSVTVNGTHLSGLAPSVTLSEPNGSYPYSVGSVTGYSSTPTGGTATVNGRPAYVDIAYTSEGPAPTNASFAVTFGQVGLPANASWAVIFGTNGSLGAVTSAEGSSQTVDLQNGSYFWFVYTSYVNASLPAGAGYVPSPQNGTVNVAGATESVPLDFVVSAPSNSSPTYPVNFTETGLPGSVGWTVFAGSVNGSALSGSPIELFLPNGTWLYSGSTNATGFADLGYAFVTVNGGSPPVDVPFSPFTILNFNVSNGVGSSPWEVEVSQNGSLVDSEYGNIVGDVTYFVADGAYQWNASAFTDQLTPSNGSITATGSSVTTVMHSTAEATYGVTVKEAGFSGGGPVWNPSIWLAYGPGMGYGFSEFVGGAGSYTFQVPNGTYGWSATDPNGSYVSDPASGIVVVHGHAVTVSTNFTAVPADAMHVVFEQSAFSVGLGPEIPPGDTWSVVFDGMTQSTTGEFLLFVVPNGTYNYTVSAPGTLLPVPAGGSVTIEGIPAAGGDLALVYVYFIASPLAPGVPHPASGLPSASPAVARRAGPSPPVGA